MHQRRGEGAARDTTRQHRAPGLEFEKPRGGELTPQVSPWAPPARQRGLHRVSREDQAGFLLDGEAARQPHNLVCAWGGGGLLRPADINRPEREYRNRRGSIVTSCSRPGVAVPGYGRAWRWSGRTAEMRGAGVPGRSNGLIRGGGCCEHMKGSLQKRQPGTTQTRTH